MTEKEPIVAVIANGSRELLIPGRDYVLDWSTPGPVIGTWSGRGTLLNATHDSLLFSFTGPNGEYARTSNRVGVRANWIISLHEVAPDASKHYWIISLHEVAPDASKHYLRKVTDTPSEAEVTESPDSTTTDSVNLDDTVSKAMVLILQSANDQLQHTLNTLVASYKLSYDREKATLQAVRDRISLLYDKPYVPSAQSVLKALYPSEDDIQYYLTNEDSE